MATKEWTKARKQEANRRYYLKHKEKVIERTNEWRANNRERVNALARAANTKHRVVREGRRLLKTYGLSEEAFNTLITSQENKCAICEETKPLVVDHNHITGEVRGLLCQLCNRGLGHFQDSRVMLSKAQQYLG